MLSPWTRDFLPSNAVFAFRGIVNNSIAACSFKASNPLNLICPIFKNIAISGKRTHPLGGTADGASNQTWAPAFAARCLPFGKWATLLKRQAAHSCADVHQKAILRYSK